MYNKVKIFSIICGLPLILSACQGGGSNSTSISGPITYSYKVKDPKTGKDITVTGKKIGSKRYANDVTLDTVSSGSVTVYATSANLKHAEFGFVRGSLPDERYFSTFTDGSHTRNMPTAGTATYNGKFVGEEHTGSALTKDISGNVSITANFSSGNVDGRVSDIKGTWDKTYDIKMRGKINGNSYSGSADLVSAGTNTTVGTTVSSTHRGGFLGNNAAEVHGIVSAGSSNGTTATGSYGAKK